MPLYLYVHTHHPRNNAHWCNCDCPRAPPPPPISLSVQKFTCSVCTYWKWPCLFIFTMHPKQARISKHRHASRMFSDIFKISFPFSETLFTICCFCPPDGEGRRESRFKSERKLLGWLQGKRKKEQQSNFAAWVE